MALRRAASRSGAEAGSLSDSREQDPAAPVLRMGGGQCAGDGDALLGSDGARVEDEGAGVGLVELEGPGQLTLRLLAVRSRIRAVARSSQRDPGELGVHVCLAEDCLGQGRRRRGERGEELDVVPVLDVLVQRVVDVRGVQAGKDDLPGLVRVDSPGEQALELVELRGVGVVHPVDHHPAQSVEPVHRRLGHRVELGRPGERVRDPNAAVRVVLAHGLQIDRAHDHRLSVVRDAHCLQELREALGKPAWLPPVDARREVMDQLVAQDGRGLGGGGARASFPAVRRAVEDGVGGKVVEEDAADVAAEVVLEVEPVGEDGDLDAVSGREGGTGPGAGDDLGAEALHGRRGVLRRARGEVGPDGDVGALDFPPAGVRPGQRPPGGSRGTPRWSALVACRRSSPPTLAGRPGRRVAWTGSAACWGWGWAS